MEAFATAEEYLTALESRAALPEGFRVSTASLTFRPVERDVPQPLAMNLSLILLDQATPEFAGVYTANRFPGAPVAIGRERLGQTSVRGVLVNNRISNVCTPTGRADAERLLAALAREVGSPAATFLPASTGIIGWRLPVAEMQAALPELVRSATGGSFAPVARAIMTTDRYPKLRSRAVGAGRLVGIAKGAGMIEPHLGTMLCFLCTDVCVGREELRAALAWAADRTLNRISIDSDQSTSDMAVLLSSRAKGPADPAAFRRTMEKGIGALSGATGVVFGIPPSRPETGYGYIEAQTSQAAGGALPVIRFVEKPDAARAREYMARSGFFWNSGIFLWNNRILLGLLREHMPELSRGLDFIRPLIGSAGDRDRLHRIFETLPRISIDFGIMEKTAGLRLVPAEFVWDDIGNWSALARALPHDDRDDASIGPCQAVASDGCISYSDAGTIAVFGASNLIVVQAIKAEIERIAARPDVDVVELNFKPELIKPVNTPPQGGGESETGTRGIGVARNHIDPVEELVGASGDGQSLDGKGDGAVLDPEA